MIVIMKSDCFDKNFIDNSTFITWKVLHLMVRLFTLIQAILINKPKLPKLPAVAVQRDHHRWEHIMVGSKCIHTQEGGLIVHHSENDDGHLVELYCADLMKAAMRRASWSAPFTVSDPAWWIRSRYWPRLLYNISNIGLRFKFLHLGIDNEQADSRRVGWATSFPVHSCSVISICDSLQGQAEKGLDVWIVVFFFKQYLIRVLMANAFEIHFPI